MFWVALATAIMMLSGEGDDVRAVAALIAGLREAISLHVENEARRDRALDAVGELELEFKDHREELESFGDCVEAVDRKYDATQQDYDACESRIDDARARLGERLRALRREYDAALEPAERAQIAQDVFGLPQAWILDPTLTASTQTHRFRGIEGTAARRHLTLPRNVVGIVFGPLGPQTFGQRFPSRIVDAGTSFAQDGVEATDPAINTRLGCRFGLFDDIEGGAVFLPLEVSPDFRFEQVLAYVTKQYRTKDVDLAFRFSLQTPGELGWSIAPGGIVGVPGQRVAVQAGAFLPIELGTFQESQPLHAGFVVPVRATVQVVRALWLSGETGVAYDDFDVADSVSVPLGFGGGYALLAGSRLVEFTGSFTWDHFLQPGTPNDSSLVEPEVFRVAFGATMYFQAL